MRPAFDVARDCRPYWWVETNDRQSLEECAALIQRDREELVREICEMIEREFDAPHIIDCGRRIASMIERKFLKGADDGR